MNEWDSFDRALAESMVELLPSEDTVHTVTPWQKAINRIILGLCLTCFTLNFAFLHYILPAIGTVELYLGFRALRKTNHWFQFGWFCSICKVILLYINFTLNATPYIDFLSSLRSFLQIIATLLLFISLRQALKQAAGEVGCSMEHDPILWALLWYLAIIALALFFPQPGWLVSGVILIAFLRIINALVKITIELENWGYVVRSAPVLVSAGCLRLACLGFLLALVLLCVLYSNHIPLNGIPIEQKFDSAETDAVETHLLELGFPASLLEQLPEEELLRLRNAANCTVALGDDDHPIGSRKGTKLLAFDTVYVRLDNCTIRVYEFFQLRKDTLRSNFKMITQLNTSPLVQASDITSAICWTKDGVRYRSDMPVSLEMHNDMFLGSSMLPSSLFSYPFFSQNRTGYMAYTASRNDDKNLFASVLCGYLTTYQNIYPYGMLTTDIFQTDWYAQSYSYFDPSKS